MLHSLPIKCVIRVETIIVVVSLLSLLFIASSSPDSKEGRNVSRSSSTASSSLSLMDCFLSDNVIQTEMRYFQAKIQFLDEKYPDMPDDEKKKSENDKKSSLKSSETEFIRCSIDGKNFVHFSLLFFSIIINNHSTTAAISKMFPWLYMTEEL